jgi:hypothetical protein
MSKIQPTVKWEKYLLGNNSNYLEYLSKYGQEFLQLLATNLINAHKTNKPSMVLFTFRKSSIVCSAQYSEYEYILKKIMSLCEKLEYYEICAQILKHFKRLQKKENQLHKLKFNNNVR